MKIFWTPEARQDRADIWDYLLPRDAAAVRIDELFSEAVARLADFPMLGHEGEVPGTRELTPHKVLVWREASVGFRDERVGSGR